MHTEEEAKQKWCPFGAGAREIGEAGDNGKPIAVFALKSSARCIASQCMAWRWKHDEYGVPQDKGFCGLAGKEPE